MSTDDDWERWGAEDPYFGVLTNPRFRRTALDDAALAEFFESGRTHVRDVLTVARERVDPAFDPRRILDFGCGVGRLVLAFAETADAVVGVDVSPSMLAEASRNCAARGVANVELKRSDDTLSEVSGQFDLVHSAIVLQHIEVARGRLLFERLVDLIRPGGVGALHVTYGLRTHDATFGRPPPPVVAPPPPPPTARQAARAVARRALEGAGLRRPLPVPAEPPATAADPTMLMNYYDLSELMFILQRYGVSQVHSNITDHGGALGAFLFFRRP